MCKAVMINKTQKEGTMNKKISMVSYFFIIFSIVNFAGFCLICYNKSVLFGVILVLVSALIPNFFYYALNLTDEEMIAKPELENNSFFRLSHQLYRLAISIVVLALGVLVIAQVLYR